MKARDTFYFIITNLFSWFPNIENERKLFDSNTRDWLKREGKLLLILSYILFIFINSILSIFAGDFFPDNNPNTMNFLEDIPNLINYIIITPIYMLFGITFIYSSLKIRKKLFNSELFKHLGFLYNKRNHFYAIAFYFLFAFLFTPIITAFYGSELNEYGYIFWFQSGETRINNAHSNYYLIYNFFLLYVVLTAVVFHFEMFWIAKKFGSKLKSLMKTKKQDRNKEILDFLLDYDKIRELFSPYISLYSISKIIIISVLLNLYTWRAQQPEFIGMLDVTIIAYTLLGAAIVSYPRYHIQYWLYKAWQLLDKDSYPDIRYSIAQGFASLADVFILGAALINLLNYVFIKIGAEISIINLIGDFFQ